MVLLWPPLGEVILMAVKGKVERLDHGVEAELSGDLPVYKHSVLVLVCNKSFSDLLYACRLFRIAIGVKFVHDSATLVSDC